MSADTFRSRHCVAEEDDDDDNDGGGDDDGDRGNGLGTKLVPVTEPYIRL